MTKEIWSRVFSKEKQPLQTIGNLRIIVHPFFYHHISPGNDLGINEAAYAQLTQQQYQALLTRCSPKQKTDITILMPATPVTKNGSWDRKKKKLDEQSFRNHPEMPNWKTLNTVLRNATDYEQNILIVKDLVFHSSPKNNVQTLRDFLQQDRSLSITPATIITLSGEDESGCILTTGNQLLHLPDISSFRIDKATSIGTNDIDISNAERLARLQRQPELSECIVTDNGDYFNISKDENYH